MKEGDEMNVGLKIKIILVELGKSQRWLSNQTGIDYDLLNRSLNGSRVLKYEELAKILFVTGKSASEIISPLNPTA